MGRKRDKPGAKGAAPAPAGTVAAPGGPADLRATLELGFGHHRAGRLGEAMAQYRRVLDLSPRHPDALHMLGVIALQSGQTETAIQHIQRALEIAPQLAQAHHNLGFALRAAKRLDDALAAFRRAVELKPDYADAHNSIGTLLVEDPARLDEAEAAFRRLLALAPDNAAAHNNLGVALHRQGRHDEAAAAVGRALELEPDYAQAHNSLGLILSAQGRGGQAVAALQRALQIAPDDPAALNNLGLAIKEQGDQEAAIGWFRRALEATPDYAEAHNNLGLALANQGRLEEAAEAFRQALTLKPDNAGAHINLGATLQRLGAPEEALRSLRRGLHLEPDNSFYWQAFADSFRGLRLSEAGAGMREDLARCLAMEGIDPSGLATPVTRLLADDPEIRPLIEAAKAGTLALSAAELGNGNLAARLGGGLLLGLMARGVVPNAELEALLAALRRTLLRHAAAGGPEGEEGEERAPDLDFLCALAGQCFLNEYVYAEGDEEAAWCAALEARIEQALAAGAAPSERSVALLACYRPLHRLEGRDALLAGAAGAAGEGAFARLLAQQIGEPREELEISAGLPRIGEISDPVSQRVHAQYEENPYPRWLSLPAQTARPLAAVLGDLLPHAARVAKAAAAAPELLVPGCGTGAHAIQCARRFSGARVTALDLSRASLAYGVRKARALGVSNIEFAQADILALADWERRFDVIDCGGVLHHMDDPLQGWRILLGLLKPGGVMKIGLYSEIARRPVAAAAALLAERDDGAPLAQRIRRFRQELIALPAEAPARKVALLRDFYATSECRDLLAHVQEHRFTLPQIAAALAQLELEFLGFEHSDRAVLDGYRAAFETDPAATDLDNWHRFEEDHPEIFIGMYQFWVRPRAA